MSSVVWMAEPAQRVLCKHLASESLAPTSRAVVVNSVKAFLEATRDPNTVAFIDSSTLGQVESIAHVLPGPIVVICDEPLHGAIAWLHPHQWISHVISTTMLDHPIATEHLDNVMRTLTAGGQPRLLDWLGPTVAGRRIRLTQSSKREARLERMSEFFDSKAVGPRTLQLLRDATEELLTNAFYDAPVAAGALKPVSRTQEVNLPDDHACDLAYGCREDLAIVRVRDPFGSLSRRRLVEVLTRCARTDMKVEVDETMGGAGLGMWRIFSGASFVAISVVKNRHTEVLVGIAKRATAGPKPFAFHFFFKDSGKRRFWRAVDEETNQPSINKSVLIVTKSK